MLNRLLPGSHIKVEMINEAVVLNGSVRTPVDAIRAVQIATQFVSVEIKAISSVTATGNTDVQATSGRADAAASHRSPARCCRSRQQRCAPLL